MVSQIYSSLFILFVSFEELKRITVQRLWIMLSKRSVHGAAKRFQVPLTTLRDIVDGRVNIDGVSVRSSTIVHTRARVVYCRACKDHV